MGPAYLFFISKWMARPRQLAIALLMPTLANGYAPSLRCLPVVSLSLACGFTPSPTPVLLRSLWLVVDRTHRRVASISRALPSIYLRLTRSSLTTFFALLPPSLIISLYLPLNSQ